MYINQFKRKIMSRLFIGSIVILFTGVALWYLSLYITYSSEEMILATIYELASHDMKNIETYVRDRWQYMSGYERELSSRPLQNMEEVRKELERKSELMHYSHVGLIDDEGDLYTDLHHVFTREENPALEFFRTRKKQFVVRFDDGGKFTDIPEEYILYGYSIADKPLKFEGIDKTFVGIVVYEDISVIRNRLQITCFENRGFTSLIGRNGYYIIPDASETDINAKVSFYDVMRSSRIEGYTADEVFRKVENNEKLQYWVVDKTGNRKFMSVEPLADMAWKFVITIDGSVFKDMSEEFIRFVVGVLSMLMILLAIMFFAIRRMKEQNEKLYFDVVENVYNKKYYLDKLANTEAWALAIIDLDRLKNINDTYGHLIGDWVIKESLIVLGENIRDKGIICRFGGDEFLVLVSQSITAFEFENMLEKIHREIHNVRNRDFPELRLTFSIGGCYGRGITTDMVAAADKLLYEAKIHRDSLVTNLEK